MTPCPEAVFSRIAERPGAVWLDSGTGAAGWSILSWGPSGVLTDPEDWPNRARALASCHAVQLQGPAPFHGGLIGYIGYGAGAHMGPVAPCPATVEPPLWLGHYDGALCFRHRDRTWHLTGPEERIAGSKRLLSAARAEDEPEPPRPSRTSTISQDRYEARVRQILAWIAAGDCYQVNLTRPVHVESVDDPWQAYRRLRRASSAHFGAFLRLDQDLAILSNSPELFLEVRGRQVASMPIKGTRPRGDTAEHDAELSEELLRSPKDRAELAMIVDLVRNDLGRVSIPGTVRCAERSLSALANVHHAAQRVEAILDPAIDLWDALVATFPPGSVTGAPKVRATHRIAQLEPSGRGVYCGAIGYASGGRSDWSVAIRTAVWHTGKARYHVGGGVVAASEPAAEWAETEAKGTALLLALAGSPISRALLL